MNVSYSAVPHHQAKAEHDKNPSNNAMSNTSMSNKDLLNVDTNNSLLNNTNSHSGINKRETSSPTGFSRKPLLPSAPLAHSETEDDLDDRDVVLKPYPGVDDGFFSNDGDDEKRPDEDVNPEVEFIPTNKPKEPEEPSEPPGTDVVPIVPRMGPDGDDNSPPDDENDGRTPMSPRPPKRGGGYFPYAPGFGPGDFDVELGSNPDIGEPVPDLNVYQHKKTLAQGMMDLALFSANANQLRYVLEGFPRHRYYYPSLALISISLIMQIAVGMGLIWNATLNVGRYKALCLANKINNFTVIGIFLVTVINVFISAFGVSSVPAAT